MKMWDKDADMLCKAHVKVDLGQFTIGINSKHILITKMNTWKNYGYKLLT